MVLRIHLIAPSSDWANLTQPAQGGILGNESHLEFANETLHAGDVAYFPNQRAYWFREATGKKPAETINVSGWSFQVLLPSGNETWLGRKSPVNGHLDGNIRTKSDVNGELFIKPCLITRGYTFFALVGDFKRFIHRFPSLKIAWWSLKTSGNRRWFAGKFPIEFDDVPSYLHLVWFPMDHVGPMGHPGLQCGHLEEHRTAPSGFWDAAYRGDVQFASSALPNAAEIAVRVAEKMQLLIHDSRRF